MILELYDIEKTYKKRLKTKNVLKGIDFYVDKGEMVAIMGKSGVGKSTLLNIMGGILKPDSGRIIFNGEELDYHSQKHMNRYRREHVGFVVQDFALIEERDVYSNVELALKNTKMSSKERERKVNQILEKLGLEDEEKTYVSVMSGGEKQRVAIARAIIRNPDIILADEPTGALDEKNTEIVLGILQKLAKEGKAMVIVTHNKSVALKCNRIIDMVDDRTGSKYV